MRVIALTPEFEIEGFDCGDSDLNDIPFYKKNGFKLLSQKEEGDTVLRAYHLERFGGVPSGFMNRE